MTRRERLVRKVLRGGPSDHRPFIQSLLLGTTWVTVCTYNTAKNSGRKLAQIFGEIAGQGTGVWLLQEVKRKRRWGRKWDPVNVLRRMGLDVVYEAPEFAVAWRPQEWTYVTHHRERVSPVEYWTTNYLLVVILQNRETGELHRFVSAHPPAHVQAPRHPSWSKVFRVLHDFADKARRISRRRPIKVVTTTIGLDLNVDLDDGWKPKGGWGFIHEGPLKVVNPPDPTRGGRGIDVLMVNEDVKVAAA